MIKTIYITKELHDLIAQEAAKEYRTFSGMIGKILQEYLASKKKEVKGAGNE